MCNGDDLHSIVTVMQRDVSGFRRSIFELCIFLARIYLFLKAFIYFFFNYVWRWGSTGFDTSFNSGVYLYFWSNLQVLQPNFGDLPSPFGISKIFGFYLVLQIKILCLLTANFHWTRNCLWHNFFFCFSKIKPMISTAKPVWYIFI